jgi:hypothetical protein
MKPASLAVIVFCTILGIALGLVLRPLAGGPSEQHVALWLEVSHRVATSVGGLGSFVALVVVLRQFYLLRTQSDLVQKNIRASMDAQLYSRLDQFNRFVFEHSKEYDLLDVPFGKLDKTEQRSKLHRMCEMGFTFFEEIFIHHSRLRLLETEDWEKWELNLLHFLTKPYVRGYWCTVCARYARSFRTVVDEMVARLDAKGAGGDRLAEQ